MLYFTDFPSPVSPQSKLANQVKFYILSNIDERKHDAAFRRKMLTKYWRRIGHS